MAGNCDIGLLLEPKRFSEAEIISPADLGIPAY